MFVQGFSTICSICWVVITPEPGTYNRRSRQLSRRLDPAWSTLAHDLFLQTVGSATIYCRITPGRLPRYHIKGFSTTLPGLPLFQGPIYNWRTCGYLSLINASPTPILFPSPSKRVFWHSMPCLFSHAMVCASRYSIWLVRTLNQS